jgi:cell division protein FtsW
MYHLRLGAVQTGGHSVFFRLHFKAKDKLRTFRHGVLTFGMLMMVMPSFCDGGPSFRNHSDPGVGAAPLFVGGGSPCCTGLSGGSLVAAAGYYIVGIMGYGSSRIELWKDPFSI